MFMNFFSELRQAKVPVTLKEYLMLMEALDRDVIDKSVDDFYYLSRAALVKDEKHLDRFDQVFGHVFKGLEKVAIGMPTDVQAEWLKALSDKFLSDEDRKMIEEMGGFEKLMEMMAERMRKPRSAAKTATRTARGPPRQGWQHPLRRQWLPSRRHPHRPGQGPSRRQGDPGLGQARVQRHLGQSVELGTHNIKVAPRRLRKFARQEPAGRNWTSRPRSRRRPTRPISTWSCSRKQRNTIKVLIFFDIGGSMDKLYFSSARSCSRRRRPSSRQQNSSISPTASTRPCGRTTVAATSRRFPTWDVLNKYGHDY